MATVREQVKALADDVLAKGGGVTDIRLAVFAAFDIIIGHGGMGDPDRVQDWPLCRYCGAWGGGGHGGFCPAGTEHELRDRRAGLQPLRPAHRPVAE